MLTCPIDVAACGILHSLKWFKGTQRVAVVSGDGFVQNIESDLGGKYVVLYHFYRLRIPESFRPSLLQINNRTQGWCYRIAFEHQIGAGAG